MTNHPISREVQAHSWQKGEERPPEGKRYLALQKCNKFRVKTIVEETNTTVKWLKRETEDQQNLYGKGEKQSLSDIFLIIIFFNALEIDSIY